VLSLPASPETTLATRFGGLRATAALATLPAIALVGMELAGVQLELPGELYLPAHATIEIGIAAMALATFAVQWFAAGTRAFTEARARYLAASFLGVALLELLHLLVYPGMPGLDGPANVERSIYYWLAARAFTLLTLLLAVRIRPDSDSRFLRRRWLMPLGLSLVVALVVVEVLLPPGRAWFYDPQLGLTPLKRGLEWVLAATAFGGAAMASRRSRSLPGGGQLDKLAAALFGMGLAEVCLSLYRSPFDLLNLAGHLYLGLAFWFLFDALFVNALLRPYRELEALQAHVEDELVVTIRRLERMREQREDFLRAVSHDLRNPLQVVLLQAERIGRATADAPEVRRPVSAIRFAGRRMERMLRDLTDAAQLEVGELRLARERVDLRAFVEHLLEVEQGVLDSSRVENRVDPLLDPLEVDPDRLDRILVNLLGNALKYSTGAVQIGAEVAGQALCITVADKGPGIPPDDLPRLFERYYRGHRHEGEGLGLGLFIVKGLVEAHGGEIGVASTQGEGSLFTIRLPLATSPAPP
jgi:signal transduction histidine kinase